MSVPDIQSGKFELSVVYFHINVEKDINVGFVRDRLESIKNKTTIFSVIARSTNSPSKNDVLRRFRVLADLCKEYGKDLVIYPHDNTYIESAEEALTWIQDIDKPNVTLSFHLCHELRHNNASRIEEVIQQVSPYISYVTISGGDSIPQPRDKDWSDVIKPLDEGTFHSKRVFDELKRQGFNGLVVFHTFGINESPSEHLPRSLAILENYRSLECDMVTFLSGQQEIKKIEVFPNPSSDGIYNLSKKINWKLFTLGGTQIISGYGNRVDLSNQSNGLYVLRNQWGVTLLIK